jgi:hypothetical protein
MIKTSEVLRNAVTRAFEGGSTFANTDVFEFEQDVNNLENYLRDNFEDWKRDGLKLEAVEEMITDVIEKHIQDPAMSSNYITKITKALYDDLDSGLLFLAMTISQKEAQESCIGFPRNCTDEVTIYFNGAKMWAGDQSTADDAYFVPTREEIRDFIQLYAKNANTANAWVTDHKFQAIN